MTSHASPDRRARALRLAAATLISATLAIGGPGTAAAEAPAGLDFYTPAADLVPGPHGSVIWSRSLTGDPGLERARNSLVLYRSVDANGNDVPVSGTVSVPEGTPPPGGWPLISWAHGTTGIADGCAPSRDTGPDYPSHGYTSRVRIVQQRLLDAGYAVAQTDYQGLGTPGRHGYLIGVTEARAIADMALAAREIAPEIGARWATIGHSQGGQAAVFTAALGQEWAPQLRFAGAVAIAPGSNSRARLEILRAASAAGPAANRLAPPGALAFLPLLVEGARTAADIDPARFLTPEAIARLPLAHDYCIGDLMEPDQWGDLTPQQVMQPTADLSQLSPILDQNEPGTAHFDRPLLVMQGRRDTIVLPLGTDATVTALLAGGQPVDYHTTEYATDDHYTILDNGYPALLAWTNTRFDR
ncbi:lipase family protein [Nocardia sp. NPDC051981]|uniref:alpha/beta hydrolase family protein n=1 Tax=Nocardia sp. NPDC051981 TaxID=3155417 RepID=UPI0034415154